mgnify:FL=1
MKNLTFNEFCHQYCDGLYDPNFPYEKQCTGYKKLREMVEKQITPASEEEYNRWSNNPTIIELLSIPDIKYMTSLHVNLRPLIREKWNFIKNLTL